MANESKIIEVKIVLEDAIQKLSAVEDTIKNLTAEQKKLNTATSEGQKRNAEIIAHLKAEQKERATLVTAIAKEINIQQERAKTIDRQVDIELKAMKAADEAAKKRELQNARDASLVESILQKRKAAAEQQEATIVKLAQKENEAAVKKEQAELKKQMADKKSDVQAAISADKKIGYINQLKTSVQELEQQYYRLSEAELKGAKGKEVLTALKEKREELSKLNEAYGNYSLGVGNYGRATNNLSIQLGQVMKELPNFAISARIGIMSLTNNLPMLAEAFKQVKVQQAEMIKEGQKAPSMFSLITKSVFGLTGIVSLAMVAIQLFSGEIVEWITNLFKADEAVKKLTASQIGLKTATEAVHDALDSGELQTAIKSIAELQVTLTKSKGSTELQKKALDEYNKSLGVTFGKAKNVDEALKLINKNKDAYIDAVKNMAIANAFFNQTADNMVKIMQLSVKSNAEILGTEAQGYINSIEKAQERLKEGATELRSEYDAAGNKVVKFVAIPENRLRTEVLMATKVYNDAADAERVRQLGLVEKNNEMALAKGREYYDKYATIVKENGFTVTEEQRKVSKSGLDKVNADIEQFLAKMRKTIFDANKNLIQSGGIDKKFQEQFIKDYEKLVEEGKRGQEELNKIRMMFRQMAVDDADLELATAEAKGESSFQLKLNLLEKQRQAEVEYAKQIGNDTFLIEQYYAAKRQEIKREELKTQLMATGDMLGAIAELFEENTTEYKIFATAQALMNTYLGVTNALGQTQGGIIAQVAGAVTAFATGIAAVKKIWTVKMGSSPEGASATKSSGSNGTSTVKFHSGGVAGSAPDSPAKEQEITRTLLTTERVLSPKQTSIFDSMISSIASRGGADSIVGNVGANSTSFDTVYAAMSKALQEMPAPVMTWQEFERQQQRQQRLKSNAMLK